jgi:hypothetical protein
MPNKLTNTAKRALGQGSKAASMSGKSPGKEGLTNTASRATTSTGKKSPADFGKLGMNTLKANKAKTGGKAKGGY